VVGGASALLAGRRRWVAFAALLGALVVYHGAHESLPDVGLWWDVAMVAVALMPLTFALVYLMLPLRTAPWLPFVAVALAVLAAVLQVAGLESAADFAKLFAVAFVAWWFLSVF